MTGTVKWFNAEKGYGFICMKPSDKMQFGIGAEMDLFVHARQVLGKFPHHLEIGQRVSFEVKPGRGGGWEAAKVVIIPEPKAKEIPA